LARKFYSELHLREQDEYKECKLGLLIDTAIDRGEKRGTRIRNCFNSFPARADVNFHNDCALGDQPKNQREVERNYTAINRGVNERATCSLNCKPL
jgi:hypothetical protein